MNAINAILLKLTGVVLAPFLALPSQVALLVLSVVAGILAALAFRYTSSQAGLKRVADQVRASLLAMRLFKDDLRSVFAAQGSLFRASGLRLVYSLPPLVVLIVPFVLLLAQLAMWYEFRPLAPGEDAVVEVKVAPDAWAQYAGLRLAPPEGVAIAGPVRDVAGHKITWDLRPARAGGNPEPLMLHFQLDGRDVADKQLVVSEHPDAARLVFVSPIRAGASFWERVLYPGEPAFASDSPIQRIAIDYGSRSNTLWGWDVHWLITFFVVSVIGALAIKPIVKVQF